VWRDFLLFFRYNCVMEKEYSQYGFDEVRSLYGDRFLNTDASVQQEKLDIQDRDGLVKRIEAVAGRASGEDEVVETVDESIPLTLAVLKSNNYWSVRLLIDTPPDQFDPNVFDEKKTVANIAFEEKNDGVFFSDHRYVLPEYRRGNGIGGMLLVASEAVMRERAAGEQKSVFMKQSIVQLDVMIWLLKNGYEPDTDEDRRKLDTVLSGDESLCVTERNYIFPVNVPEKDRTNLDSEKAKKAFRVSLVKKIKPGLGKDVTDVSTGVVAAVEDVIPS
jgi:hypothetical protein